ncbi:MAG: ATP-binding protein [Planctomycetota bacterium]|nr:ATP-binding protein [Planctomycetota bacterium]
MTNGAKTPEARIIRYYLLSGIFVLALVVFGAAQIVGQVNRARQVEQRIGQFHLASMVLCDGIGMDMLEARLLPIETHDGQARSQRDLEVLLHLTSRNVAAVAALQAENADPWTAAATVRLVRAEEELQQTDRASPGFRPAVDLLRVRALQLARLHDVQSQRERTLADRASTRYAWQLAAFAALGLLAASLVFWRIRVGIDEILRARRQSEEESAWLQYALDQSGSEALLYDPSTLTVIRASSTARDNMGYSADAIRRAPLSTLAPELGDAAGALAPLISGELPRLMLETVHQRADGSRYPVQATFQLVGRNDDHLLLEVARDTTEITEARERVRQGQKMEAIGQLAGGIAHDFNNLLTVILGSAEMLSRKTQQAELGTITQAAENASALTQQLLHFSRKSITNPIVVDLPSALEAQAGLLRRMISEDIDLRFEPSSDVVRAVIDPAQLQQVIMNLCVNSRDAMPDGGRLVIATDVVELDAVGAAKKHRDPGRYAVVSVTDSGVGMTPEAMEHAFEPFFTTKPAGEGTGLGLATVFGVAQQNDGFVEIESEPGRGTAVNIYLPWTDEEPAEQPVVVSAESETPGGETIMIVEDEPEIGWLLETVLTEAGYRVVLAQRPDEALRRWPEVADQVDLLLTDLVMPGMRGDQLAVELMGQRADLKVLFMTGYAPSSVIREGVMEEAAILQKPFTPTALLEKVRTRLELST